MRILHVSDVFLRYGGGGPNVIKELGIQQIKKGHQVSVLTFQYKPDWPLEEIMEGISVYRTPIKSSWLPFYFYGFKNVQKLASKVLAGFQPDLIHVHMPFSGLAVASQLQRKIPIVYTFHGSWAEEYAVEAKGFKQKTGIYLLEKKLMRWIEKRALKKADKIVTLSKFMQGRAKRYEVTPQFGWEVVPAGVDLVRFSPVLRGVQGNNSEFTKGIFRREKQVPKDAFLVFTVRRLAKRMGLENLIKAIDIAREKIPEIFLIIGGKGELKNDLQLLVTRLRQGSGGQASYQLQKHIRLEGFIPDKELPNYFAAADLFVLPTQALEGFGLIILESMACGTPVLGTPVGAIPEVIRPFNQDFIFSGTEASQIAEGIIKFYHQYYQRQNEKIRKQAQEYTEKFSWERMGKEYERIYRNVIRNL